MPAGMVLGIYEESSRIPAHQGGSSAPGQMPAVQGSDLSAQPQGRYGKCQRPLLQGSTHQGVKPVAERSALSRDRYAAGLYANRPRATLRRPLIFLPDV